MVNMLQVSFRHGGMKYTECNFKAIISHKPFKLIHRSKFNYRSVYIESINLTFRVARTITELLSFS